jgi:demethylspheroidene O-methyltransferase
LPKGRDVVTLVRVVHDHDDPEVLAILKAARAAIADDGTLVIAEPMAGTRGAETVGSAYFGLYLLAMGSGRARTVAELRDLLVEAGFQAPREHPTRQPLLTSVVSTRPRV